MANYVGLVDWNFASLYNYLLLTDYHLSYVLLPFGGYFLMIANSPVTANCLLCADGWFG
jgi:hypothetical protein